MSRSNHRHPHHQASPADAATSWETLRQHTVRVGPDVLLPYHTPPEQEGHHPSLIFVPGISSDGRAWFRQTPLAHRHQVAFFDNPLDVPEAPYTFETLALLLRDAVRQICDRPPVLVGSSFGGMVALTYALTYPEAISGLVLASSTCDARWFGYPFRLGHRVVSSIPEALFCSTFPAFCRLSGVLDRQDAESLALFAAQGRPFKPDQYANRIRAVGLLRLQDRLKDLHLPVLILHGTADRTVPVRMGIRMARMIPRATLRLLQGGGHSFYLNEARWFNHELEHWLDVHHLH